MTRLILFLLPLSLLGACTTEQACSYEYRETADCSGGYSNTQDWRSMCEYTDSLGECTSKEGIETSTDNSTDAYGNPETCTYTWEYRNISAERDGWCDWDTGQYL